MDVKPSNLGVATADRLLSQFTRVAVFSGFVAAVWLVPASGLVLYGGLAVWALRGTKPAVEALTLAWLLSTLNPEIYVASSAGLRWPVLLAAVVGILFRTSWSDIGLILRRYSGLSWFVALAIPSVLISVYPLLSVSKIVGFALGAFAVIGLFFSDDRVESAWATDWYVSLFWAVVLLSLPLLWSDVGYQTNGQGFQGILNQPQAFGVFLTPFVAFFLLAWITRFRSWFPQLPFLLASYLLLQSQARTGGAAAIVGVAIALGVMSFRSWPGMTLFRQRMIVVGGLSLGVASVAVLNGVADRLKVFVLKPRGSTELSGLRQSLAESRGLVVSDSVSRIAESPVFGNGFGIAADLDRANVQTLGGFPIGAPLESGFAGTGVAEQVGVVGLAAMIYLIYQTLKPMLIAAPAVAIGIATSALATNIGEATIVSFGGMGLIVWMMIGWGAGTFISDE